MSQGWEGSSVIPFNSAVPLGKAGCFNILNCIQRAGSAKSAITQTPFLMSGVHESP